MTLAFRYRSLALVLVAACSGSAKPTQTPPTGGSAADPTDVAPPADLAFKDMTADQRVAYMKLSVMPEMKVVFQEFDAKEFADFTCKTCHGKSAEDGTFDMPNPDIARLPKPENFMAYAQDPKHGPWVQFMGMKVKPAMANLLKVTEFDPTTNTGEFGCHGCHFTEGEDPAAAKHTK